MMSRPQFYIIGLLSLLGFSGIHAQDSVSVKLSVDRNQILIGEPIRLSLDVKSPYANGNLLPQFDSLPHFELIEKANLDSLVSVHGVSYHEEWKLTSFDSGTRVIPAFTVSLGRQIYKTDSLVVEVSYGKIDTAQDYHDIKGIIDIENPSVKYIPWIVGAVTLIALLLFFWLIRRPFAVEEITEAKTERRISPLDEAMQSLDVLKKMALNDPPLVKKYYSGINDALRIFMNRRFGIITMEKTNEELIIILSGMKLDHENFLQLKAALRMSDFVKFAKYVPGPFENETNLELIRSSIILINETGK